MISGGGGLSGIIDLCLVRGGAHRLCRRTPPEAWGASGWTEAPQTRRWNREGSGPWNAANTASSHTSMNALLPQRSSGGRSGDLCESQHELAVAVFIREERERLPGSQISQDPEINREDRQHQSLEPVTHFLLLLFGFSGLMSLMLQFLFRRMFSIWMFCEENRCDVTWMRWIWQELAAACGVPPGSLLGPFLISSNSTSNSFRIVLIIRWSLGF